ncbi:uncharacterized protein LOC133836762 [Drosophila sulfurigaster albostrigata]|uniref:uncharacterized protein LOC133836762 n=1 Tax=Drosophila sulfurigaster albostrigata TaxID=89887 RepID=UPI002D219680|nr:uncharacterized protein LOC133836762 [Drosophila sulfurigaster albostrigata]
MDQPKVILPTSDKNKISCRPSKNTVMSVNSSDSSEKLNTIRIVAFHYFESHYKQLYKWLETIATLTQEYEGRITFEIQDIKTINNFHRSLDSANFGSYHANVAPRLYGVDKDGFIYTMHMLFSYKYIRDFCDKLLEGKVFEAIVLGSAKEFDLPPQNFYHLIKQSSKDLFVMFYDPAWYQWTLQLGKLRKLTKILVNEEINIVIVNRGQQNYLGIDVDTWSESSCFQGITRFVTKRTNGWISNTERPHDSFRGYLRYIAKNINPELKEYDKEGTVFKL